MQCIWKIILASLLAFSTSISVAGTFDSMVMQSGAFLYDKHRLQLPGEITCLNPNNSNNNFQRILNTSCYSVLSAQGQGMLWAEYNNWPVSETHESSLVEFHPVPEPPSLLLIGLGMFGLALVSYLQQKRNFREICGLGT